MPCPYTLTQNGKAKCAIRSLNNVICSLLFQASMPPTYRVDALTTAALLLIFSTYCPPKRYDPPPPIRRSIVPHPCMIIYVFSVANVIPTYLPQLLLAPPCVSSLATPIITRDTTVLTQSPIVSYPAMWSLTRPLFLLPSSPTNLPPRNSSF
jgi:hypothetical protein